MKITGSQLGQTIKGFWDKVVDVIEDIPAQLGLQPKLVPVRAKSKNKEKKK